MIGDTMKRSVPHALALDLTDSLVYHSMSRRTGVRKVQNVALMGGKPGHCLRESVVSLVVYKRVDVRLA